MKIIKLITVSLLLLIASFQATAQKPTVPGEKLSGPDMQFEDWDLGEAQIIALSMFSNDSKKYRFQVGTIQPDGKFSIRVPESIKTWVPVGIYGKGCINKADAKIENGEAKMAWTRFFVFDGDTYLGSIMPANPVKAAYNLNQGGVNNGSLGKYYLRVYVDGNASVDINCEKKRDITDGKGHSFKDWPLKDGYNLNYKKGWNIVEVHVLDNIWVGLTKHYTSRTWKTVEGLPNDITWVFRPGS